MKRIASTLAQAAFATLVAVSGAHADSGSTAGGYDYASKFYPHPAGLYLLAEQPRELHQHPAVLIARRARQQQQDTVAEASGKFYMHPAGLALSTVAPQAPADTVLMARR